MHADFAMVSEAWERGRPLRRAVPVLAAVVGLALFCPAIEKAAFRLPSAGAVSAVLHVPCRESPEGYVVDHPRLAIRVAPACSGTTFFALALLTMFWVTACAAPRCAPAPAPLAALLPAAYLITLTANVSRILLCWGVARVARSTVAEPWHGPLHLATGFAVLTFFLIVAYAAAVVIAGRAKTEGPS